ncbi:hypothetical protein HN954_02295 [bacterium]|jgi:hypothetical protein|nr:hypothetical protein [bacterium]MBT6831555.1 hypothetical protein [bacterium]MBT6996236.1 hypothetical protein [bacterium]MBT7772277.1 hypothetical protein [bacterium]
MKKFLLTIALSFLFLVGGIAHAGISQGISGKVTDAETGDPIPAATVGCVGKPVGGFTGIDDGKYEISVSSAQLGSCDLQVIFTGYQSSEIKNLVISSGKVLEQDFQLQATATPSPDPQIQNTENQENALTQGTGLTIEQLPKYLVGVNSYRDKNLGGEGKELKGDATDVTFWLQRFIRKFSSIIAALGVLFIIWNAFGLVTAAGSADDISKAKTAITWVIIALVLVIFAYVLVKTVISLVYLA